MKALKIHHVLYSGLGGPGNVFQALVEADQSGDCVYSAAFCGIEPLRKEYEEVCQNFSVPYEYIKKKRGLHLGVYRSIYKSFNKQRPGIILLHGVSFILPAIVYRIFHRSTKVVIRDTQAHHLKSKMEWVWLFICAVFANRIVVLTEESGAIIKKKLGFFCKKKIRTIANGLNTDLYKPIEKNPPSEFITIGMQSRLQPIKDHITLVKAFKVAVDRIPEKKLKLEIAGDGVTRKSIEAKIDELGIRDLVVMHGMLDTKDLVPFMQSLDIYVHATFGETLSNSIMQAMACGLPVIASDVWGVNNMIVNEQNGILYKSADFTHLAEVIIKIVGDSSKRNGLAMQARVFAEENYSNKAMAINYRNFFRETVNN